MADKMMRISGRDQSGKARAVKTDADGNIGVLGKSEHIYSHKGNIVLSANSGFYEVRDASTKMVTIPQLLNQDGSYLGVFDQSITLVTNYDVTVKIRLHVNYYDVVSATHKYVYKAFERDISPSGTIRTILLPMDISSGAETLSNKIPLVIPELKFPVASFTLEMIYATAPKTGETILSIQRRF